MERRGKGVAAIVSIEDLAVIEALEDREDVRAAKRALAERKQTGDAPIPQESIKKELGLE